MKSSHCFSSRKRRNIGRNVLSIMASFALVGSMIPAPALAAVSLPVSDMPIEQTISPSPEGGYSLTFQGGAAQGESFSLNTEETSYTFDLPACPYSYDGYVFAGWKIEGTDFIPTSISNLLEGSFSNQNSNLTSTADVSDVTSNTASEYVTQNKNISFPLLPDKAHIENMSISVDVDENGNISDNETFQLNALANNNNDICLTAQWIPADSFIAAEDEALNLENAKLVAAPRISSDFGINNLSENPVEENEPNAIGIVDAVWIDENGDPINNEALNRITVAPSKTSVSMRAKISVSVRADSDILAGQLKIRVPKTLFRDRNGERTGKMSLAVPQAPSSIASFAYDEEDEFYVISNMKRLARTNQTTFEFSFLDITPNKIKDYAAPYSSDPFYAAVSYDNGSGTVYEKSSRELLAELDTQAKITNAGMRIQSYNAGKGIVPSSVQLPESPDDYYYAAFYAYANTSSNQPYSLIAAFEDSSGIEGTKVLNNESSFAEISAGSSSTATVGYSTFYVAYPKSIIDNGETHSMSGRVKYTLASIDDKEQSERSATASQSYTKYTYVEPEPIIPDPTPEDPWVAPDPYYSNRPYFSASLSENYTSYNYYLNKLLNGQSVSVNYLSSVIGLYNNENSSAAELANMGTSVVYSTGQFFQEDWATGDKYLSSITLNKPLFYSYHMCYGDEYPAYWVSPSSLETYNGGGDRGYMGYFKADMSYPVEFYVEGYNTDGSWTHIATATYRAGGYTVDYANGKSNSTATVSIPPASYSKVRVTEKCEHPSVLWAASITETITPSEKIANKLTGAIGSLDEGNIFNITAYDYLSMDASLLMNNEEVSEFSETQNARNTLTSFAYGTRTISSGKQISQDVERRNTVIQWQTSFEKTTNLSTGDFSSARQNGAFQLERTGTFFCPASSWTRARSLFS